MVSLNRPTSFPYYACARCTDCAVCESGYSPSLGTTCTPCSGSKRQGLIAAGAIVMVVAVFAIMAFSAYLVSTDFNEREKCCLHSRIIRAVPLQAFKIIIVVWPADFDSGRRRFRCLRVEDCFAGNPGQTCATHLLF